MHKEVERLDIYLSRGVGEWDCRVQAEPSWSLHTYFTFYSNCLTLERENGSLKHYFKPKLSGSAIVFWNGYNSFISLKEFANKMILLFFVIYYTGVLLFGNVVFIAKVYWCCIWFRSDSGSVIGIHKYMYKLYNVITFRLKKKRKALQR